MRSADLSQMPQRMRWSELIISAFMVFYLPQTAFAQPTQPQKQIQQRPQAVASPVPAPQQKPGTINLNDPNVHGTTSVGNVFSGLMDAFEYDPRGRRDPFSQPFVGRPLPQGAVHGPLLPLQKFELRELRLTGILWDVREPKAMIKDPQGNTHIVVPNSKIGPRNGYVASIREGEIIVVETIEQDGRLVSTAQVVKIAK